MRHSLSLIGCGKLGRSLGRLWSQSGTAHIADVLNRTHPSAEAAAAFIGAGRATASFETLKKSEVFLIGTPDGDIAPTCARLASTGLLDETSVVFHCSGALDSGCLQAARERGATVASIHPIKSFALPEAVVEQ
ncbi:MAG TPA: NAD(P)-binding domain-containing protein, partial [Burkholderiaceae bacterium]